MARSKKPPLTEEEIELAKAFCIWEFNHRYEFVDTDMQGSRFSTKNMTDLCDQFLMSQPRSKVDSAESLVTIVRRYRAQKAAETKKRNKKRIAREEIQAHTAAILARQKSFDFKLT